MTDTFTLRVQARELDYIAQLLAKQPWGEVNTLMGSIQQQVTEQQQEAQNAHAKLASVSGSG